MTSNEAGTRRPEAGQSGQIAKPHRFPPIGLLLLDDEETIRALMRDGLQARGFHVWVAADGKEAVEIFRRHLADIQMVLLDVQLPGQDGPETLAHLQSIDPKVTCCFLTGDSGCYSERELTRMGARRVFYKPVRLTRLARSLARLVRQKEAG